MAVLRSPFYGENLNLILLRKKIQALDYAPLPSNSFSHEVCFLVFVLIKKNNMFSSFVILLPDVLY
jgi:hypothetical protein